MKQFIPIFLVLALVTLCGCAAKPAPAEAIPQAEESVTQETPVPEQEPEPLPESKTEVEPPVTKPEEEAPPAEEPPPASDWSFTVEDEVLEADIEEIVSYTIHRPHITLESASGTAILEEKMEQVAQRLVGYARTTVYATAQAKQAIAFLNADYKVFVSENCLSVDYDMDVEYRLADPNAAEYPAEASSMAYAFDLETETFLPTE